MNISQRAFYYVTRKKGKSLLLLAILLAMGSCVLTGLAIWRAAGEAQLELRQSLGGRLAISVDWQNSPYVVEEKLAEGKNVILEIEIQGALKIKKKFPESLLIFVTPPNAEELKRRLEGRGTESQEVIASRLARAAEESEGVELYDYLVVNDKLEESAEEVHHLVAAARRAPVRREEFVRGIREELHSFAKGAQE